MKTDYRSVGAACAAQQFGPLGVCAGMKEKPSTSAPGPITNSGSPVNICVFDSVSCWAKAVLEPGHRLAGEPAAPPPALPKVQPPRAGGVASISLHTPR
jgi:hypothetical protein